MNLIHSGKGVNGGSGNLVNIHERHKLDTVLTMHIILKFITKARIPLLKVSDINVQKTTNLRKNRLQISTWKIRHHLSET